MSVTKDQYYRTLLTARDQLRQEGFPCPKIEEKNILLVDEKYQFALDLNVIEENRYRFSLVRLDEIICEMLGVPMKELEPGFWIHYGENFSRDIPECWKTKSKVETATKDFDINGNELDKYDTYGKQAAIPIKTADKQEKPKMKESKPDDTYGDFDFPDTYS